MRIYGGNSWWGSHLGVCDATLGRSPAVMKNALERKLVNSSRMVRLRYIMLGYVRLHNSRFSIRLRLQKIQAELGYVRLD